MSTDSVALRNSRLFAPYWPFASFSRFFRRALELTDCFRPLTDHLAAPVEDHLLYERWVELNQYALTPLALHICVEIRVAAAVEDAAQQRWVGTATAAVEALVRTTAGGPPSEAMRSRRAGPSSPVV